MPNTPPTYSRIQSLLHWTIAAMVIFQVLVNHDIGRAYHAVHDQTIPSAKVALWASIHVWGGTLILFLALWLIALRWTRGVPSAPNDESRFLKLVALGTKIALYALVIGSPLTGIAAWFLDVRALGLLHSMANIPAKLLILLHFCGALYQHFVMKSNVLSRILPIR